METLVKKDWKMLAENVIKGYKVTAEEALAIVQAPDNEVLEILNAAFLIRQHYYGKKVKLNMIINTKSGLCPEDCGYCSQSIVSEAPIDKYAWLTKEKIVEGAKNQFVAKLARIVSLLLAVVRPIGKLIMSLKR